MNYSIDYVERVRSTDYPSYHSIPYWSSTFLSQNIVTLIGESERSLSVQKNTTMQVDPFHIINNIQATISVACALDDSDTRKKVWRVYFGDSSLPRIEDDPVNKYYGSLDKYVDWTKIDLKKSRSRIDRYLDE
jgi:hypothetical protein